MILLHLICENDNQANKIVDFLLERKLILDAVIMEKITLRRKLNLSKEDNKKCILIMAKTKALLFQEIDKQLKEQWGDKMPTLFSVPIVNMDWSQSEYLINNTAKV